MVRRYQKKRFNLLTIKEWPDAELLEGMREHYPRIEMDSEVVVIHHLPPEA
ncbi:hypothetical protein ACFFW8_04970 [Erwinia tracheiphila]